MGLGSSHLRKGKGHEHDTAVGGADELLTEAGQVGHDASSTHLFSEGQRAGSLPVHFGGDEEHGFPGGHAVQLGDGHDVNAGEVPLQHIQHGHVEIGSRAEANGQFGGEAELEGRVFVNKAAGLLGKLCEQGEDVVLTGL